MATEDRGPDTPRVIQPEDASIRHPWERQDGEGERAFQCFKAYRDQSPPRQVHRAGFLGGVRVASGELSKWFREHRWEERCLQYDVLTDRIIEAQRRRFLEQSVDDMAADQLASLNKLRRILSLELDKYMTAAESGQGVGLIKPADLKGLLEAEVKLTRLIKGETTEAVGVKESPGIKKMDAAELMAWRDRLKELEEPN